MNIGLHVKYSYMLYLPDLMKLEFSGQVFEKHSKIKFRDSSTNGSRVIPRGRTVGLAGGQAGRQAGRQAGMTKLVATF